TLDVLAEVTAFSNSTSGPGGYVVQAGDTLQSIAPAEYGDASLWYVIAQANALGSDSDLAIGQRLTIPQVTTNSNTATTFKPYDPSSIVGSTTPNLPVIAPPPPPPSSHCNVLAQIIVIAVVVVVSYFTAGALSGPAMSLGESILVGAAAGAAGSAAGQLAGDALGVHQGFSFGELALGAAGGAIAGGVGYGLSQTSTFTTSAQAAGTSEAAAGSGATSLNAAGYAVEGAASYVGNYEAGKALNQPAHFSWAGLVAASVGTVVGGELGSSKADAQAGKYGDNYVENLGARAAEDIVTREVSVGLGDNHVQSWAQIGEDVAGNAIGQPIGEMALDAYRRQQMRTGQAKLEQARLNGDPGSNGPVSLDGQAALDKAWQGVRENYDPNGVLARYNEAGVASMSGGAYGLGDQSMADYMARIASDPQAMLAYESGGGGYGNGPLGRVGPPPIISTDGDPIYASASAAANRADVDGGNPFANVTSEVYTTQTYGGTSLQWVQHADGTFSAVEIKGVDAGNLYGDGPARPGAIDFSGATPLPASEGTLDLPPVLAGRYAPHFDASSLESPPLAVPAYVPDIAAIDTSAIQLDASSWPSSLASTVYNVLASQYQQGEKQLHQAGQWFDTQAQHYEQRMDNLRVRLNAYGDSQGGMVKVGAQLLSNQAGFGEGAAIGLYKMGEGIVSLANGIGHVVSPYSWAMDPQANLQRITGAAASVATLDALAMTAQVDPRAAWTLAKPMVNAATADYRSYLAQGDYAKAGGRFTVDVASVASGFLGEAGKLGEGTEILGNVSRAERTQAVAEVAEGSDLARVNVPDTATETITQPSFTPYRSELGLDFETQTTQTPNGTSITVQSNQTVAADGSIVDQGSTEFPANQLRATFDSQTGNLNIDWLGANPQQSGLGTEMVSRAIEQLGPENVTSISGDLDASNEGIYDYYYNDLGYSSQDALQMTPAAKIRATLGYSNVGFNSSGQVVGYRVPN
ncbi:MAG: LysM peptidoglycan-binding domain-containing protein, partial [Rhodanobacter sp.]